VATPLITLTTDFGTADGYVGALRGVLARLAPRASVVDLTHEVPRGDVAAGAFALAQAAREFPTGTIHVAVVDPGVGSARAAVIVDGGGMRFVGPDTGLFSLAAPLVRAAVAIEKRGWRAEQPSATFHGRDLFAVAAARLARGGKPAQAGRKVTLAGSLELGAGPQVIHVDHFGNLITNVRWPLGEPAIVRIGRRTLPWARTYAEVEPDTLLAYVGSAGTLEIAVRDGSAAQRLKLGRGARVAVTRP
jgi:S-adenosylmethionine hydrolase